MMKRREFISLIGGAAAAYPLVARAQQPAMPVVGVLHPTSLEAFAENLRGFRQGLKETGYVEGEKLRSNFAGLTISSIDCLSLRPIWFAGVSP
jgi:putative ABC transport system substrate-binding protein